MLALFRATSSARSAASNSSAGLSDPRRSARALSLLATAHAETGDETMALAVVSEITNVGLRDRTRVSACDRVRAGAVDVFE